MQDAKPEQTAVNDSGTQAPPDTGSAHGRSGSVQWEVVDYRGEVHGPFHNAVEAFAYADAKWPDQEQDEDGNGLGWDIQTVQS